jgi:hypothetical protein
MTSRPIRLLSRSLLRLRRQGRAPITAHGSSRCYTDEKIIATINHYYQLKFRYLFIIFTENQQRKLINFIKYDNMTLIF